MRTGEPRPLRPGDADLPLAVRRPASVRRAIPRAGRLVDRKGDRRAPLRVFEESSAKRSSIRRRRRCCSTTCRRRSAICSKRHSAADGRRSAAAEPARLDSAAGSAHQAAQELQVRSDRTFTRRSSAECPWCRIEDAGGPAFFVGAGGTTIVSADRLAVLDDRSLQAARKCSFPNLPPQRLALPSMPKLRRARRSCRSSRGPMCRRLMVARGRLASARACRRRRLADRACRRRRAVARRPRLSARSASRRERRRKTVDDFRDAARRNRAKRSGKRGQAIEIAASSSAKQAFDRVDRRLEDRDRALSHRRRRICKRASSQYRESQKAEFLRGYLIRDNCRKIPGLTPSQVVDAGIVRRRIGQRRGAASSSTAFPASTPKP